MDKHQNLSMPPLLVRHTMKGQPIRVVSRDREVTLTPMQAVRFAQALLRSAEAELSSEWQ